MADKICVKSLFDLATVATYHHMVAQLKRQFQSPATTEIVAEANLSPPKKKKRKVDSSLFETKKKDPPNVVRAQLDEYLVSWYSHLRPLLLQRFVHNYCDDDQEAQANMKLILSFFDSVLDQNFTSLSLNAMKKINPLFINDPIKLLEIITQRSPLLKTLDLNFRSLEEAPLIDQRFGLLLGKLTHLTSLTLSSIQTTGNCADLFSSLSQTCPQLATLQLVEVPFGTNQILALMLGSKRALLSSEFPKDTETLADVQFSPECLTPLCNNLKVLRYDCEFLHPGMCRISPIAFFLRHFKNLEVWESCRHLMNRDSLTIIRWLIKKNAIPIVKRKSPRLLPKSKTTTNSSKEIGSIQWTVDAPFTDQLNLVSLRDVRIKSRRTMQAVTSYCPNLKEIGLMELRYYRAATDDLFSVQELRSFLLCQTSSSSTSFWSKVTRLRFDYVPSDYRQAALSILGHQLQGLRLQNSASIGVIAELEPRHQLEELEISYGCTLLPPPVLVADFPSADTFLPCLKTLKIHRCIGPWSPLFERHRPLLIKLKLGCPHIGNGGFNWIDAPNLWPNLREMFFAKVEGLTLDTLREIVPQFKHLERLNIPNNIIGLSQSVALWMKEVQNQEDPADAILVQLHPAHYQVHHY